MKAVLEIFVTYQLLCCLFILDTYSNIGVLTLEFPFFFFFSLAVGGARLLIDSATVNAAIVNSFKLAAKIHDKKGHKSKSYNSSNGSFEGATVVYKSSPISIAKALKNCAEIEGMRNSHLR